MAVQDRSVLLLYGSETGNAQDVADEIGRMCQRLHFKIQVDEMNAVELVSFSNCFLLLWLTHVFTLICIRRVLC